MPDLVDRFVIKQPRFRRFLTKLLEGDSDVTVNLFGAPVRINTIKEHGYLRASRIMRRSSFVGDEAPVLANLSFLLNRADAFVDAGANVGAIAAFIAKFRHVHPLPIYAFEANPDTYARLAETAKLAGIESFNMALSDREGSLNFHSGVVSHIFTAVDEKSAYTLSTPPVAVPCRRLDSFPIRGSRIILKIDVEGHEWPVLQGASALFEQDRIFACYVDGFERREIPEYLRARGFKLFDGRSFEPEPKGHWYSLLAVKES